MKCLLVKSSKKAKAFWDSNRTLHMLKSSNGILSNVTALSERCVQYLTYVWNKRNPTFRRKSMCKALSKSEKSSGLCSYWKHEFNLWNNSLSNRLNNFLVCSDQIWSTGLLPGLSSTNLYDRWYTKATSSSLLILSQFAWKSLFSLRNVSLNALLYATLFSIFRAFLNSQLLSRLSNDSAPAGFCCPNTLFSLRA